MLSVCCVALLIRVRRLEAGKPDLGADEANVERAANEKAAFNLARKLGLI